MLSRVCSSSDGFGATCTWIVPLLFEDAPHLHFKAFGFKQHYLCRHLCRDSGHALKGKRSEYWRKLSRSLIHLLLHDLLPRDIREIIASIVVDD